MDRKVRKAVIVVSGALVLSGALPYGFGLLAEKAYTRMTDRLAKSAGLRVTDRHYFRGWLGATATMTLTQPGVPVQYRLTHHIAHGPFPYTSRLAGQALWLPVGARVRTEAEILGRSTNEPSAHARAALFTAETLVRLSGGGESHLVVVPGQTPRGTNWGPGAGTVRYTEDQHQLAIDLDLSNAELHVEPLAEIGSEHLSFTDIHMVAELSESTDGVLLGEAKLMIGELSAPSVATLRRLKIDCKANARKGLAEMSASPEIGEVSVGNQAIGALRFDLELKRVDLAELAQYDDAIGNLTDANTGLEELSLQALGRMIKLMSSLSKTAPEIEIRNFLFQAKKGDITGSAKLTLDGRHLNTQRNPMLLLVALRGEAELDVARALMRNYFADRIVRASIQQKAGAGNAANDSGKTNMEIDMQRIDKLLPGYMAKDELGRYFRADGDRFKAKVSIRRGQVTINDRLWSGSGPVSP